VALADPARLETLLGHLLQNAIEASPPAAPVTLAVDGATIEVIDGGCGMSAAFIRHELFKPFVSTKPGGFGIGAYEARALAHAMGGSLSVSSREGAGTSFRIALRPAAILDQAA
jgi:signal transduction histidine kinase